MSSSIFSSEYFRRYAALPRAKRRWHAIVAGVLALSALVCARVPPLVYGASGCRNGTLGSAAIASLSDRTEVLFVGSSHVLFGIRPQRYSVRAMNIASAWLDYTCALRLVEKHLPRVPNVKVAVIEYDELPLVADVVPAMIASKDVRSLTELSLSPLEFPGPVCQKLQALYTAWAFSLTTIPRLTPWGWENRGLACTPLHHPPRGFAAGYYYTEGVTPSNFNAQVLYDVLTGAARKENIVQRNLGALQQTIDLLRRRGITVVLLRLPHASDYTRSALVTKRWQELQAIVDARRRTDAGVLVWDFGQRTDFQRGDFVDIHHLNVFGADKLARLLDADLLRLCRGTAEARR
jgi:hypothetical protein